MTVQSEGFKRMTLARDAERAGKYPMTAARVKLGLNLKDMAARIGMTTGTTLRAAEMGRLAPNSPLIPYIAKAYEMTEAAVSAQQKRKPMDDNIQHTQAQRLETLRASGGMRARGVGGKPRNGNGVSGTNGTGNGDHAENGKRTYTKRGGPFKAMTPEQRESLRTLTNTVNLNAMKGIKETTVPTQMIANLLRELYAAKGVEGVLVLDTIFERLFD